MKRFLNKVALRWANENYGRHIILKWGKEYDHGTPTCVRLLDVGVGVGNDIEALRNAGVGIAAIMGLDYGRTDTRRLPYCDYRTVNIETDRIPAMDKQFDIVLANQVLEHCKEIPWIMHEIARVSKPGALVLIGVPNMACWYNRLFLLFGIQPASMEVLGPHVRGFCRGSMTAFLEATGMFKVEDVRGSNVPPLPVWLSRRVGWWFPSLANCNIYKVRRTYKPASLDDLRESLAGFETNYKGGPLTPAAQGTVKEPGL
jgi:SAM-dependent methyltransferase